MRFNVGIFVISAFLSQGNLGAMMTDDGGMDEAQGAPLPPKGLAETYGAIDQDVRDLRVLLMDSHKRLNTFIQSDDIDGVLGWFKGHIDLLEEEGNLLKQLQVLDHQILSRLAQDQETCSQKNQSRGESGEASGVDLEIIRTQIAKFQNCLDQVNQDIESNIQALEDCLEQLHTIETNVVAIGDAFRTGMRAHLTQKMDAGEIDWGDLTPRLIALLAENHASS
jgi:uncharacterized protein YukE